jgi:hypothetical protein
MAESGVHLLRRNRRIIAGHVRPPFPACVAALAAIDRFDTVRRELQKPKRLGSLFRWICRPTSSRRLCHHRRTCIDPIAECCCIQPIRIGEADRPQ